MVDQAGPVKTDRNPPSEGLRMRHVVFSLSVFLAATTIGEAATIAPPPVASGKDIILAQSYDDGSQDYYSGKNYDRQRRARFVCVITPPESANRRRPYICPLERGRVGGSCRCSGVVGNGTVDTAW